MLRSLRRAEASIRAEQEVDHGPFWIASSHAQLAQELLIELAWVIGLFALNRLAFNRGVRRYGAFGG
jgi:hypothetical protein